MDGIHMATEHQGIAYAEISRSMESIDRAFADIKASVARLVGSFADVNKLIIHQLARLDRYTEV
jgi:hypothetical protein